MKINKIKKKRHKHNKKQQSYSYVENDNALLWCQ